MKRAIVFLIILGVALAALYFGERHQDKSHVSPNAVLEMAADLQRDVTRAPMRVTRLSDDEEINIGNELAERYSAHDEKLSPEQQGLQEYIAKVGTEVSSHAHRHLPYRFHLIPNRSLINAFSLPGGETNDRLSISAMTPPFRRPLIGPAKRATISRPRLHRQRVRPVFRNERIALS